MVRDALVRVVDARQLELPRLRMIAMQDTPIGWLDGVPRRKHGAARTEEKVAHQQREGALEHDSQNGMHGKV